MRIITAFTIGAVAFIILRTVGWSSILALVIGVAVLMVGVTVEMFSRYRARQE